MAGQMAKLDAILRRSMAPAAPMDDPLSGFAKPRMAKQRAPDLESVLRGEDDPRSRDVRTRGRDIPPTPAEQRFYDRVDEQYTSLVPLRSVGDTEPIELLNYPDEEGAASFAGGFEPESAAEPQEDRALERAFGRQAPEGFPEEWFNPDEPSLADTRLMGPGRRRVGQDNPGLALAFEEPMAEPPSMEDAVEGVARDQFGTEMRRRESAGVVGSLFAPLTDIATTPDRRREFGEMVDGVPSATELGVSAASGVMDWFDGLSRRDEQAPRAPRLPSAAEIGRQVVEGAPRIARAAQDAPTDVASWLAENPEEASRLMLFARGAPDADGVGQDIIRSATYGPWENNERMSRELINERIRYDLGLSDDEQRIRDLAAGANTESAWALLNAAGFVPFGGGARAASAVDDLARGAGATDEVLRATQVAPDARRSFEGAPLRVGDPIEVTPQRTFQAAMRDPETGQVFTGADHWEALDSIPDESTRQRLEALYTADTEDPSAIGFLVDGQFMGREEGLQALRAQRPARGVRIGEELDVRTGEIRPANPINWDASETWLPAERDSIDRLAGVPTSPRLSDQQPRSIDARASSGLPPRRLGEPSARVARPGEIEQAGGAYTSDDVRYPHEFADDPGAAAAYEIPDATNINGGPRRPLLMDNEANLGASPAPDGSPSGNEVRLSAGRRPAITPAVRVNGQIYQGDTHLAALSEVPADQRAAAQLDGNNRGYVDERGRFMNNERGTEYARNYGLIRPEFEKYAGSGLEIPSEWMAVTPPRRSPALPDGSPSAGVRPQPSNGGSGGEVDPLADLASRVGDRQPRSIDARATGIPQRRLGDPVGDVNAAPARPATEAGTNADSAPMRGTGNVREPERFWDERLSDQQNAIVRWALTGRNNAQIAEAMIEEGIEIAPNTIAVQLNRLKTRAPDVYERIGPARRGRIATGDSLHERAVRIADELEANGQGGRGSIAIIAERLGITPEQAQSAVSTGRWRRNRNSSDPLGSIAAPAAVVGGSALLLGGEAEAQEMDGLEPLPEGVNLRDEGEWLGSWFRTTLPDGSGGIARVIRGPDGTEYTIVGRQAEDLSIEVLGVRPVSADPPGPPSPRVGTYGPEAGDLPTDAYGWNEMPVDFESGDEGLNPIGRAVASLVGGYVGRRLGGAIGARGITREAYTGFGAAVGNNAAGGDPLESLAYAAGTPIAFNAPRIARAVDDALPPPRPADNALLADDNFAARSRAYEQQLLAEGRDVVPRARQAVDDDIEAGVFRDREIPDDTLSAYSQFRDASPAEQWEWMNREGFRMDLATTPAPVDGAGLLSRRLENVPAIGRQNDLNRDILQSAPNTAYAIDPLAAIQDRTRQGGRLGMSPDPARVERGMRVRQMVRGEGPAPEPITPENLDDIAPQPRGFRATPDDIMANPDRGTLAQRSRLLNMLATLAERYGVDVPRGPRGGIQDKRLSAALARAAQNNPALQAEMRRMGIWSTVIAAGGLGAASTQQDPLAQISQ